MSEQDRIAFEKWYSEKWDITAEQMHKKPNGHYIYKPTQGAYEAWQAATAEANKRTEALEGEVVELKDAKQDLEKEVIHLQEMNEPLQANNHDLREAISKHIAAYRYVLDVEKDYREYGIGGGTYTSDAASHANSELISSIEALVKLESATPAESLQAHDDELIEKCAKVADAYVGQECLANAIRALKEVK